jgi:hypothetical protein
MPTTRHANQPPANLLAEDARPIERKTIKVEVLWPRIRPRYLVVVGLLDTGSEYECASFSVTTLREGTPVNSAVIRSLSVGALVAEAIQQLLRVTLGNVQKERSASSLEAYDITVYDSEGTPIPDGPTLDAERKDFLANRDTLLAEREAKLKDMLANATGQGNGRRYPAGHLDLVAEIVRESKRAHMPTTAAVAEKFKTSKSAAGNLIGRARAQGLLDNDRDGGQ